MGWGSRGEMTLGGVDGVGVRRVEVGRGLGVRGDSRGLGWGVRWDSRGRRLGVRGSG